MERRGEAYPCMHACMAPRSMCCVVEPINAASSKKSTHQRPTSGLRDLGPTYNCVTQSIAGRMMTV